MPSPEHDKVCGGHTSTTNIINVCIVKFGQSLPPEIAFWVELDLTQILSIVQQNSYDIKFFIMNNYFLPPKDNEV